MLALFGISVTMFVLGFFPNVVAALIAYRGDGSGGWHLERAVGNEDGSVGRRTP